MSMEQSKCASKLKKKFIYIYICTHCISPYTHVPNKRNKKRQSTAEELEGLQNNRTCANIYTAFIQVLYILSFYQLNTNIRDHNDKHVCTNCQT